MLDRDGPLQREQDILRLSLLLCTHISQRWAILDQHLQPPQPRVCACRDDIAWSMCSCLCTSKGYRHDACLHPHLTLHCCCCRCGSRGGQAVGQQGRQRVDRHAHRVAVLALLQRQLPVLVLPVRQSPCGQDRLDTLAVVCLAIATGRASAKAE